MTTGGMSAPPQRIETSASDATVYEEPVLPPWDMSTAASRAEWKQGRLDARNRIKAEANAAELGQVLSPLSSPGTAMLLHYDYLRARRGWERYVQESTTSSANTSFGKLVGQDSRGKSRPGVRIIKLCGRYALVHWQSRQDQG